MKIKELELIIKKYIDKNESLFDILNKNMESENVEDVKRADKASREIYANRIIIQALQNELERITKEKHKGDSVKDYKVSEILDIANKYLDKMGRINNCFIEVGCNRCVFNNRKASNCLLNVKSVDNAEILNIALAEAKIYLSQTDWTKVEVDTKVLVKAHGEGKWYKRHFAKYKDGEVYTFDSGVTSFTSGDGNTGEISRCWAEVKLYEED